MRSRWLGLLAITSLAAGCELQEVELADTEDVVIAEVILRAGAASQLAWLHRTRGTPSDPLVQNARVRVHAARGGTLELRPAEDELCMIEREDTEPRTHGSCYASFDNTIEITPRETYQLDITLADGRALTGTTSVPADFRMLRPTAQICSVNPRETFEVRWSAAPGAWVYASEISIRGIRAALEPHSISVDRDPLRLYGLSFSASDTTITFPGEFGLFDRFDDDLTEALAFLQQGLPDGIALTEVVIAAADRNYVNWERGGNFNPSGAIRVPSVHGAGTGVFGSIVPRSFQVRVGDISRPAC